MANSNTLKDRLYGNTTLTSAVLIELIRSKPMQRLHHITQYGVPDAYNATFIRNFSRFEHSIGVMLLLKRLGATEEEQIAGLLHDASHTAFSHVIDWVVGSTEDEDFQDNQHKNLITGSEIATILTRHNYDPERISNYKLFTLLEQPVPNACADRIDYSLREFPLSAVKICVEALTVHANRIVFTDQQSAQVFALNYLETQENMWSHNESATRYMYLAQILKHAMKQKIIVFADFWTTDEHILKKLHAAQDPTIQLLFLRMQQYKQLSYLPKTTIIVPKKFRYVDPEILVSDKLVRLSSIDKDFMLEIERAKKANSQGVAMPDFSKLL